VLSYVIGFDHHVIDVDLNISSDMLFKDMVHQPLISGAYIFKAKGHYLVAKVDICNDECCFLLLI